MATRSYIAVVIKTEDKGRVITPDLVLLGKGICSNLKEPVFHNTTLENGIISIYHHWDGYPDGVGQTLLDEFNDYEKALNLVSFGDASSINGVDATFYNSWRGGEDWDFTQPKQYQDEDDNRLMVYMQTGEVGVDKANLAQTKRLKPSSDVDLTIPKGQQNNSNTFAIIIANENYEEETQVEYALNDGEIFKTYCRDVLGLPETNIHYRENATLNNFLAELDWMKQISFAFGNEAKFIFYYAGHGIPDEASGDSYLLPVDGRGNLLATGYSLKKLYDTLGGLGAKSVTVFMDACFSGSVRNGGMMASARGVAIKAKQAAPKGNMIVLSAAQGDETAYPYKEKGHGLFTYFLLKKLQETKGDVTIGVLADYVTSEVKKRSIVVNGKLQTPIVTHSNGAVDWRNWKLK